MTKLEETRELLEKADKVKPLAEKDGKVYVDFADMLSENIHNENRQLEVLSVAKRIEEAEKMLPNK